MVCEFCKEENLFKKYLLIRDLRDNIFIKFIWKDKNKYDISIKALRKAERQNKIEIISEVE